MVYAALSMWQEAISLSQLPPPPPTSHLPSAFQGRPGGAANTTTSNQGGGSQSHTGHAHTAQPTTPAAATVAPPQASPAQQSQQQLAASKAGHNAMVDPVGMTLRAAVLQLCDTMLDSIHSSAGAISTPTPTPTPCSPSKPRHPQTSGVRTHASTSLIPASISHISPSGSLFHLSEHGAAAVASDLAGVWSSISISTRAHALIHTHICCARTHCSIEIHK